MKKIILIILLLASTAFGYRLQVVYSMGGGLTATGVRTIITYGSGNSVTTAKDSTITTTISATTSPITKNWYLPDSLVAYSVTKIYYSAPDTFVEQVENVLPIEFEQLLRGEIADLDDSLDAIMDTLAAQDWANASVTLSQADIDEIVAGVISGTIGSNGTGIFAVTMYARDTINGAFVPGINLTAVSGATNLFATTSSTGAATFNVDAATWTFNALGSPYTWVPFTRAVAGNITDTITGGGVLVTAPSSPDEATVYGTLIGGDGEIAANWDVRFTLEDVKANLSDTATGQMVVIKVVETSTNSSGYFSKGLLKTENMLYKSGTQFKHPVWRMVASPSDVKTDPRVDFTFTIPSDSTSLDLGQLIKEGAE